MLDSLFRYICKEAPYGGELSFSEDSMREMHNADLCDTLGNLVHRATNLCGKYCDGVVPNVPAQLPITLNDIVTVYTNKMNKMELQGGASAAIQGFRDVNGYLQDAAPWKLKDDEHSEQRQIIVRNVLECIYALTHLLMPFLPMGTKKIFQKFHTEPMKLIELKLDGTNLQPGTKIDVGDVLYTKSLSEAELQDAATAAAKKKESFEEQKRKKEEAKAKARAGNKSNQADENVPDQPEFTKMEVRSIFLLHVICECLGRDKRRMQRSHLFCL